MGRVIHRKCSRDGCERLRASVGDLCAEHRASNPPRSYRRWDGGDTRLCARCGERKAVSEFRMQNGRPQGYCKPCRLEVNQEWRSRHHDELLARRRAKYKRVSNGVYRQRRQAWEEQGRWLASGVQMVAWGLANASSTTPTITGCWAGGWDGFGVSLGSQGPSISPGLR